MYVQTQSDVGVLLPPKYISYSHSRKLVKRSRTEVAIKGWRDRVKVRVSIVK